MGNLNSLEIPISVECHCLPRKQINQVEIGGNHWGWCVCGGGAA